MLCLRHISFASNTPIQAIDLDGGEAWVAIYSHVGDEKPKLEMKFDKDLINPGGVYTVHKYFDNNSVLTAITSGSDNYSAYSQFFPNFSKGVRDQFKFSDVANSLNLSGEGNILFAEAGLEGKLAGGDLGASFGAEGKLIGLNFKTDDRSSAVPILGWNSTFKESDQTLRIGASAGYGAGMEYRHGFDINSGTFKNENSIKYNGIITSAEIKPYSKEAILSWGIGGKAALGFGVNFDLRFSINMTKFANAMKPLSIHYTPQEKQELDCNDTGTKEFDPCEY